MRMSIPLGDFVVLQAVFLLRGGASCSTSASTDLVFSSVAYGDGGVYIVIQNNVI
jgi:hypothetical protein